MLACEFPRHSRRALLAGVRSDPVIKQGTAAMPIRDLRRKGRISDAPLRADRGIWQSCESARWVARPL